MSNILDSELKRRKPTQRPHGKVVRAAVMDSKLLGKVIERVKAVAGVKTFLILPVATLHLTIVARCVGADELVSDAQFGSSDFK